MLGPLAQTVGQTFKAHAHHAAGRRGHEQLAEERHTGTGCITDELDDGRHITPSEDLQPLLGRDGGDGRLDAGTLIAITGQEGDSRGIGASGWQLEVHDLTQEGIRDLGEDAGSVAHHRVGPGRTAVLKVAQGCHCVVDDVVPCTAAHGRDKRDPACVVLELGAVQPLVRRLGRKKRRNHVRHRP